MTYKGVLLDKGTIQKLATHSDNPGVYHFDFSIISCEYYEPLFRSLKDFMRSNVVSIGFNCDELRRVEKNKLAGEMIPVTVLNSIAKKRKTNLVQNIIELVSHVLKRKTYIKEVVFSNLHMKPEQVSRAVIALGQCKTLESVVLKYVPLQDTGLNALLNELNPNQVKSITLYGCSLTALSTDRIVDFIGSRTGSGGIESFNVSKIEFDSKSRTRIAEALGITLNEVSQHSRDIRQSPPNQMSKTLPEGISVKARNPQQEELERLRYENVALKEQLKSLRESIDAVQYSENVFIVGKNAEDFVRFLNSVESKISKLEEKKREMNN